MLWGGHHRHRPSGPTCFSSQQVEAQRRPRTGVQPPVLLMMGLVANVCLGLLQRGPPGLVLPARAPSPLQESPHPVGQLEGWSHLQKSLRSYDSQAGLSWPPSSKFLLRPSFLASGGCGPLPWASLSSGFFEGWERAGRSQRRPHVPRPTERGHRPVSPSSGVRSRASMVAEAGQETLAGSGGACWPG